MPKIQFYHLKYFSFLIYFLFLNFGGRMALNGTAFFVLVCIIGFFAEGYNSFKKFNKLLLITIFFYVLHIFSAFLSEHQPEALFDLEVKLPFLILPLIFGFEKPNSKVVLDHILSLYSVATLVAAIVLLLRAILIKISGNNFPTYSPFSPHLHVTYLAAYMTINLIINIFLINKTHNKKLKYLYSFSAIITLPIIWATQSKAGILIYFIVVLIVALRYTFNWNKIIAVSIMTFMLLSAYWIIGTNYRLQAMIKSVKNYQQYLKGSQQNVESTAERIMTWDASIQLIKQNFWLGLGNGDVRIELKKKYEILGYTEPARLKLNAHNQYLESILYVGIFGFVSLLAIMFVPFSSQSNRKSLIFSLFILTFCLHFLFESMLNTQAGVVYFVFFYALIISYNSNNIQNHDA